MIEKYLTEEQIENLRQKESPNRKKYPLDCLHSSSLDDGIEPSVDMDFDVAIVWYKGFNLKANQFAKIECPICHKVELLPYFLGASMLSGSNKFKGYCFHCHTKLAFNSSEYYHFIRNGLMWQNGMNLLFATYSKQNDKTKILEDLYSKISSDINLQEAKKLIVSITGTKDMTLKEVAEIHKEIISNFEKDIDVELKTDVKNTDENVIKVRLYAYKNKVIIDQELVIEK